MALHSAELRELTVRAKKIIIIIIAGTITTFIAFVAYIYLYLRPKDLEDPICALVSSQFNTLRCSILAEPSSYEKGAVVDLPEKEAKDQRIGIPDTWIFGDSCIAKEAKLDLPDFQVQPIISINFGSTSANIERELKLGWKLSASDDAKLSAGPKISEVRSIELSADSAQLITMDLTAIQKQIDKCNIMATCLSNISPNRSIVNRLLIAKNLKYVVTDKDGATFSLGAAIEKGMIALDADSARGKTLIRNLSTGNDVVIAVETIPREALHLDTCKTPLKVLEITGDAKAKAVTHDNVSDERETNGDSEVSATVKYSLPKEELSPGEIVDQAEAKADCKWTASSDGQSIDLTYYIEIHPGLRWRSGNDSTKSAYADSQASAAVDLKIDIWNRGDYTKELWLLIDASRTYDIARQMNSALVYPLHDFFKDLKVSIGGHENTLFRSWHGGQQVNTALDLGQMLSGDVARVSVTRALEDSTAGDSRGGVTNEDMHIRFELRDITNNQ
jgi:hypothetical protein